MKRLRLGITLGCALLCCARLLAQGPNDTGTYYKDADGKTGSELKTALYGIIEGHTAHSYSQLWTDFYTTDARSDGKVWDMYSSITNYTFGTDQAGNYSAEGDVYNREHSFPKSWFDDATPMYTDLVHIVPTDGFVNSKRSNYVFGETDSPTYTSSGGFSKLGPSSVSGYSGTVFEPNDEYKGDFARIYFYMATRYENLIADWSCDMLSGDSYPAYNDWALTMLLKWAQNDPVSQKELDRNEAVYGIQNNRNPYVDYPGLEQYVWGSYKTKSFSYDNYVKPDSVGNSNPDPDPDPDPNPDIDPDSTTNVFVKCTALSDIQAGGIYLIVYEADGENAAKALSVQNGKYRASADVTITSDDKISTETGSSGLPYQLTLGGSEGAYTFYDEVAGKYLSYSGSGNSLYSADTATSTKEQWSISISGGTASITNVANTGRYTTTSLPRDSLATGARRPLSPFTRRPPRHPSTRFLQTDRPLPSMFTA